jgi:4-hydroxy-L-threonine phosphate dehydrogenase PdxA
MHHKPILIIPGQTNSIFFEIFFKTIKNTKFFSALIVICNINIFKNNAKRYNFNGKINLIRPNQEINLLKKNTINIINVKIKKNKKKKIKLNHDNKYIFDCFKIAFKILKRKSTYKFLNGPINKKNFLNKKFLGITEYLAKNFNKKNIGMLIYNKNLSVCPLTTHLPIKLVSKKITKKLIINRLKMINNFFIKNFKLKPKIAVTGLNPHCESILNYNEDDKIVLPAINFAKKKGILVSGPYAADTVFLKQNRNKFNIVLGMYHDQVLTPLKTLFEYDAVNITMGLPFLRVSPDHGPNEKMVNKNLSNPTSLSQALKFLDKI